MKRFLAMLLCLVMVVGLVPATVFAADETFDPGKAIDAAAFYSDLHIKSTTSGGMVEKGTLLKNVLTAMKNDTGLTYSSVTSCGDAFAVNADKTYESGQSKFDGDTATLNTYIIGVMGNSVDINYVWSDHDRYAVVDGEYLDCISGLVYGDDTTEYYIYELSHADTSTDQRYRCPSHLDADDYIDANKDVTPAIEAFEKAVASMDKTKPLFIAAHQPLLDRRNDNGHAYKWAQAINKVAETMDVVYLYGHNHQRDELSDYYYAKGSTMSVCSDSSGKAKSVKLNFTHVCAGYLAPVSYNEKTRMGTALNVVIYENAIGCTIYDQSDVLNSSTSEFNLDVLVEREHEAPAATLSSIAITSLPTKTAYTVGETFDASGLVVTATYSDNSTKAVAATLSEPDMTTAGTKTVTATFEGKTTSFEITVAAAAPTLNKVNDIATIGGSEEDNGYYMEAEALGLTGMTATYAFEEYEDLLNATFTDGLAFEIALENHTAGNTINYYFEKDEYIPDDELVLYAVGENNVLTPVDFELVTESGITYISFTSTHVGTFIYGTPVVEDGYELSDLVVDYRGATKYLVGETFDMAHLTVTGIYTKDGAANIEKEIPQLVTNVEDGYEFTWPVMTAAGKQTITVSYGGFSKSFEIEIFNKDFAHAETGISAQVTVPGATAIDAKVSANENVAAAIADVIKGDKYAAYDIELAGYNDGETVSVTLPIPAGVANPVVYYVSDDGSKVDPMTITGKTDTTVTFETDHFSTYVVGESTEIKVPDPETATGTTTTGGKEPKEVYMLTSSISTGNEYLIVDRNSAGSANILARNGSSTSNTTATVVRDNNGTYIELADATDELWTYDTVESGGWFDSETYYTFKNGDYYLYYTGNTNRTLALTTSTPSYSWTYSNNRLTIRSRYLNGGPTWSLSSSQDNIYFYVKTTIEVDTTTTVSGTYSIAGNPAEVTKVVKADGTTTATLGATLLFNGEETDFDSSKTVSYTKVENGDPNGVISGISGNTVTFSGKTGKALIKVSYEVSFGSEKKTVTNYILVNAKEPTYNITIKDAKDKVVSGSTVTVKNVTSSTTLQLTPSATLDDGSGTLKDVTGGTWSWEIPVEYQHIATVDENGLVTFKGEDGAFYVTATLTVNGKQVATSGVNISASTGSYSTPTDGTNDFPEYPAPGSVNFDKTATAVGNFAQTGMVQMELSMTGVPYGGSEALDIVVLLDNSSSMDDVSSRLPDTRAATIAFLETLLKNSDGTFNSQHNILVADYHGGKMTNDSDPYGANVYTVTDKWSFNYAATNYHSGGTTSSTVSGGFQNINSDAEISAIQSKLQSTYTVTNSHPSGTDYDHALLYAQAALKAARDAGSKNKQFVVMMTDGVPTNLRYEGTKPTYTYPSGEAGNTAQVSTDPLRYILYSCTDNNDSYAMFLKEENGRISNQASAYDFTNRGPNYRYEVVSSDLKAEGVTIFTVGVGLKNDNGAWDYGYYNANAQNCYDGASVILNDIAGPAYEATKDTGTTLSKKNTYFFELADGKGEELAEAFRTIASKIAEAATNVVVTDKITDDYTMVFAIPQSMGTDSAANDRNQAVANAMAGKEMYIEVVNYALNDDHDRTDTGTPLLRVYLGVDNGEYYAATAYGATGGASKFADPVFTRAAEGAKAYWSQVAAATQAEGDDIIINVDGTAWKFHTKGDGTHNVTAGAYAFGNIDEKTNMSEDLVIVTPYFAYCAATRMLVWTVAEVVETSEIALHYFLYLECSATEIGTGNEIDPGSYQTNEWAYMYYTNHLGNECRNVFPVPQITWSGAQASYVFYLVNAEGKPINKSGQEVDFANATFITEPYTHSVVWNRGEDGSISGEEKLSVEWLAGELLPSDYMIYDLAASYDLNVYATHTGESIFDYFILDGSTADAISTSLNSRLGLSTTAGTVSLETTKVYNTKAGNRIDDYGTYTSAEASNITGETVLKNFDFYSTTVAFAVVWQPRLVEDTVVVDFGLDTLIDVTRNDTLLNTVSGISGSKSAYGSTAMNFGVAPNSKFEAKPLSIDGNTISIENENQIRFHQGDMKFERPVKFYYESPVHFWENSKEKDGYIHSSVTVIPATTVYYEDSFVNLTDSGKATETAGKWTTVGSAVSATQAQDRPGASQISAALDADNNYGYDAAYSTMSQYSMGAAKKVTVAQGISGMASFDFYGTGFDVISMTDTTTGMIVVNVYDANNEIEESLAVNNYFGYAYVDGEWVTVDSNSPNALYQVPVMKIDGLPYGKHTVKIVASYNSLNDVTGKGSYDFYLDAIRIYDPTGVVSGEKTNQTVSDAYKADGEGWPVYAELRNWVIDEKTFNSLGDEAVSGVVFIDGGKTDPDGEVSIKDYTSYGPNNELYLASGQAVAFDLETVVTAGKVASVQLAIKSVGGTGSVKVYGVEGSTTTTAVETEIKTATDMYYDITELNNKTVVIVNTGDADDAIISITNIKTTFTEAQVSAGPTKLMVRRASVNNALATLSAEEEEAVPETTVPEETEPETTVPEETVPETTVPEETEPEETVPETTVPEETEPEEDVVEAVTNTIKNVVNKIANALSNLFGRWFR